MQHALVVGLLVLAGSGEALAPQASTLRRVKGTRIWLAPPAGFLPATNFNGFMNLETQASLLVLELPGPYAEVVQGLRDPQALAAQGMELLEESERKHGPHAGRLFHFRQGAGGLIVEKWAWMFGSASETVLVMAVCPAEHVERELARLRLSVESSVWKPDAGEPEPEEALFDIEYTGKLELFGNVSTSRMYTLDGKSNDERPGSPVFIAGPALGPVPTLNLEQFARSRAGELATVEQVRIESVEDLAVDGLPGLELVATGVAEKDGAPMLIHQVMLFEGATYWILVGSAALEQRSTYLPMFRRMARSLRRARHTVLGRHGRVSLEAPRSWSTALELHEDADLVAFEPIAELYVLVLSESRADLGQLGLAEHSRLTRSLFTESSSTSEESGPVQLTLGGMRALQYVIRKTSDGAETVSLHTTVEGDAYYHQVIASTTRSVFERSRGILQGVVESFRELR